MYVLQRLNRFVIPRTENTFPCDRERMWEHAAAAPVDHVMPDFEDAIQYANAGEPSRRMMVEGLNGTDFGHKVVAIRPHNLRSKYFLGDMEAIMEGAVDRFHGIILPKTEGPQDIIFLAKLLDMLEQEYRWTTRLQIEALIETPLAITNASQIATASNRMAGLIFGIADFAAAMAVRENVENQNQNFHYAKQATAVAAKAAGLHAIDNAYLRLVTKGTQPEEAEEINQGLRRKNIEAANLGMDGTWVIHPQQAGIANECYTPSDEEIAKAKHAVEDYHQQGGGAVTDSVTGEFLDEATTKAKLMDLAKAVQAGKLDQEWLAAQAAKSKEVTGYDILQVMGRVA